MPNLDRLLTLGHFISGSAYDRYLDEVTFDAFLPDHLPLQRRDLVRLRFPHPLAMARLNRALNKLRVRTPDRLSRIPAHDLAAVEGVGERTILAACVVLEAYGIEESAIDQWLGTLDAPTRTVAAAVQNATRKGKKRRHTA